MYDKLLHYPVPTSNGQSYSYSYEPEYAEDLVDLCGPIIGFVQPLVLRCATAVQCFRFTLHTSPSSTLGIDLVDLTARNISNATGDDDDEDMDRSQQDNADAQLGSGGHEFCPFAAIVRALESSSAAAKLGLQPGETIVHVVGTVLFFSCFSLHCRCCFFAF